MKFSVHDKYRDRYLTDEELEGGFYYTGQFDRSYPEPNEYIERFEVNLLTGKIKTNKDNSCSDEDCCTPGEYYCDDDNFLVEVEGVIELPHPIARKITDILELSIEKVEDKIKNMRKRKADEDNKSS